MKRERLAAVALISLALVVSACLVSSPERAGSDGQRYAVVVNEMVGVLLDTQTGETWILGEGTESRWYRVKREDDRYIHEIESASPK